MSLKGRKQTEEHKKKISEAQKGEKGYWFGKHHNHGNKISVAMSGRKQSPSHVQNVWKARRENGTDKGYTFSLPPEHAINVWKSRRENGTDTMSRESIYKMIETRRAKRTGMYDKKHSLETRRKMRIAAVRRLQRDGIMSLGMNEKELLDQQESKDNCKILRQYPIDEVGYVVDGYCPETNTVYEVYEKHHDKQVFRDLERENEICKTFSCDFIILYN